MMQEQMDTEENTSQNPLILSWRDPAWVPLLNPSNIMDYFSQSSNPFYDHTCNNEIVKSQGISMDKLQSMTGVEYILLHVQEPILYIVRKQYRNSPNDATPLANYYIISGTIYQAPDLASVLSSRLSSAANQLQSSIEETNSYVRFDPIKGYWWDFKANQAGSSTSAGAQAVPEQAQVPSAPNEEPLTSFQQHRVNMLLDVLQRKFPLPIFGASPHPSDFSMETSESEDN